MQPDTSDVAIYTLHFFKIMMTLYDLMDLNMLNSCAVECTKQSRWKETTQRYLSNMVANNIDLKDDVLENSYQVRPTIDFVINERGHIRQIESPVVRDRIIQKALTKYILTPILRPCLIYDNYASLKLRGTAFARKRFEIMLRKFYAKHGTNGYLLLIDIKKYFDSVDHDVVKKLLTPKLVNVPQNIIDLINYTIDTSSKTNKGLNLGSEVPQILAVYYLNHIDTFVKIVKKVKYYGRYMDDIFVICETKEEAKALLAEIEIKLQDLKLELNQKKTQIVKISHGFTYLQVKYKMLESGKIIKSISHNKIVREKRRLRAFKRMYDKGNMSEDEIWNCYQSWRGTIVKDHNACYRTLHEIDKLYSSLFPEHTETPKHTRQDIIKEINRQADTSDLYLLFNELK